MGYEYTSYDAETLATVEDSAIEIKERKILDPNKISEEFTFHLKIHNLRKIGLERWT